MRNNYKYKKFFEVINNSLEIALKKDKNLICYGLGITDPKGIFGTTIGLEKKFSEERIFDVPTSENALTGIGVGASLNGTRVVMTHQRLDFFLLAMDQLVNNAAKAHYMFGGKLKAPITIRLIIGRGWGQGPTHSQNLHAWFAHIPGLKVVAPSNPFDAKGLLLSSIFDPNPVIFLEHRWLHNTTSKVPESFYKVPLGKAKKIKNGKDITIVAFSYLVIESIYAQEFLKKYNIQCEIIDLRSIKPIDFNLIIKSVKKTKNLLVIDSGYKSFSIANEIITQIVSSHFHIFDNPPLKLAMPDVPEPTSFALTKNFHIRAGDIVRTILKVLKINKKIPKFSNPKYHDVPGDWFKGPF
tara:strand:+ start:262 stop:1323 length:1062 start_codon:yes stop_codon:yes gene_type:complete